MIRFESLTKRYPDGTTAVDNLTMRLPEGQITVLVGSSGCGKTTTLRLINRMVEPSSGVVLLGGKNVAEQDPARLRRGIGYVIQQAGLFPHRTALDNIATVPRLLGQSRQVARVRSAELLELVGLEPKFGRRYPHQLSGGQQQRVGVARALAADPPVLLMDEPFGAVDPLVRTQLQDELLRLQSELRKTIVFVTHDIDEAIRLGDSIAVFHTGGRLVQHATPADLLARPADDFVAGFLGEGRNLKLLSLITLAEVASRPVRTVRADDSIEQVARIADGDRWLLVTDTARAPVGWLDGHALPGHATVSDAELLPAPSLPDRATLLTALDAVVGAPNGLLVRVDSDGAATGVSTVDSLSGHAANSPMPRGIPAGNEAV
jgi:osmoprotectant transport system ATP-binding protein